MKQEDKELLLKDLSARFPYRIKCEVYGRIGILDEISSYGVAVNYDNGEDTTCRIECVKPFLFPLSSMTEEQMFDFAIVRVDNLKGTYPTLSECSAIIDWGYKHYFDVNGLIEKGLALDATGKNIY